MSRARRQQILAIIATDATFERVDLRGEACWVGKCIHCNARLVVRVDGEAYGGVTVEHIVPRHLGGTDALGNVALACARCNSLKGRRLDVRRRGDPTLEGVIATLTRRREERWRGPPPAGDESLGRSAPSVRGRSRGRGRR